MAFDNVSLFPFTAELDEKDHLVLGGCSAVDLASEFGTPLYVYDEETLRGMCREFTGAFTRSYADSKVVYASKAYVNPALARLMAEEGLGLDVVSGGELAVARSVDFPPEDIYFHGNNKTPAAASHRVRRRENRRRQPPRAGYPRQPGQTDEYGTKDLASPLPLGGPPHPRTYDHRHPRQQVRPIH